MNLYSEDEIFLIPESKAIAFIQKAKNFEESLLVLIGEQDSEPVYLDLLAKICTAVGLKYERDISLLKVVDKEELNLQQLMAYSGKSTILSFGLHEEQFPTQFHKIKYYWIHLNEQKILFSDCLHKISVDQNLKKKLWLSLQEEFKK
jgi:hypothetical protein